MRKEKLTMLDELIYPEIIANFRLVKSIDVQGAKLFRSSSFSFCQPAQTTQICQHLGPCTYVDLRTQKELQRDGTPSTIINLGWKYINLPVHDQESHEEPDLKRYEAVMPQYLNVASEVIQRLNNGESCVIACSLGKDRTGMVTALIQQYFGESAKRISKNFELSMTYLIAQRHLLPSRWQSLEALTPISGIDCLQAIRDIRPTQLCGSGLQAKGLTQQ
ncbi:tyrosine-protein phosphatase [Pseudoalteromonas sp. S16_S37]|uniref:tyrosine-protein phosphatase n=1 Tax=Pseudoalteromonas sp. S16_S37 TaxID=2720228 RepID=UPI00167FF786|nr:tyrosine-protein phosphatase [Pseudoalteromonas sp. S16_S37]MBD1583310.1 tyrosine-protein phosphatase [Pseudoalteromonas sp. S16_S37]